MRWPTVRYTDGKEVSLNTVPRSDLTIIATEPMKDFGNGFCLQCKAIAARLLQERAQ